MHKNGTSPIALLGVTLAFMLTGIAIAAALYLVIRIGAGEGAIAINGSWQAPALGIIGYCLLAGLMVDAIRLVAALVWRKKPKNRLKLHKIIEANLA